MDGQERVNKRGGTQLFFVTISGSIQLSGKEAEYCKALQLELVARCGERCNVVNGLEELA